MEIKNANSIVDQAYQKLREEDYDKSRCITDMHKEVVAKIIDIINEKSLYTFVAEEIFDFCVYALKFTRFG